LTIRALAGLGVLNVVVFAVGAAVLFAVGGCRSSTELLVRSGVAYLLGVASLGTALTLVLLAGVPFGLATVLATTIALVGVCVAVGISRRPRRLCVRLHRGRLPALSVFSALWVAGIVVYLEGLFRSARLTPLWGFDAWWVWTIRAKTLYFFGDFRGTDYVREEALSYPLSLSLLHAQAFESMGAVDTVTLHTQHWFLAVGFVAAFTGVMVDRVRTTLLLPFVLLVLVIPRFADRATWAVADPLLGYQVAIAALLIVLWLEDRASWRLAAATLLLTGAMLTKREGVLFATCVFVAAAAASWAERHWTWRRLALAYTLALLMWLPWQVWIIAQGPGATGGPSTGYLGLLNNLDRAWPALELSARAVVDPAWLGISLFAAIACVVAARAGVPRTPVFTTVLMILSTGVLAAVFWSEPLLAFSTDARLTPAVRVALVVTLVVAPLVPLLLDQTWSNSSQPWGHVRARRHLLDVLVRPRRRTAWVIIAVAAIGYPATVLAGGAPRFPAALLENSRQACFDTRAAVSRLNDVQSGHVCDRRVLTAERPARP
jgi:hypothetical protein